MSLAISNFVEKGQASNIQNFLDQKGSSLKYLVESIFSLAEKTSEQKEKKQLIAKSLAKISLLDAFKQQLSQDLLELLELENFQKIQDFEVQDSLMAVTRNLYLDKNNIEGTLQNLTLIFTAMCFMLHHEETRLSQQALKIIIQLIKMIHETNKEMFLSYKDQLQELLIKGIMSENTVVMVRYFELACNLAQISPELSQLTEPVIEQVFEQFFNLDMLTQMAVMDFVAILGQNQQTSMILAKKQFLPKLFEKFRYGEDHYGFITNNLVVLGAFIYSVNAKIYNPLQSEDYLAYFRNMISSKSPKDQETASTCMFFFFKNRECLFEYFVHNLDILKTWLGTFRSTDPELRKASFQALRQLLKAKDEETKEKYNEIIRRIYGNITHPSNFPEMGNENQSTEYLIREADVPFEAQELLLIKVMKQLINWEWGMRSLYANSKAVSYILKRTPKAKLLVEKQFSLVQKTIQSKFFMKQMNVVDPIIGEQLEVYYSQGVYGIQGGGGPNFVPEYASKSF
ncbi:UNKNOWN [Stylonychia lemnae]|uniref:Armadillo-type fold n=1 Tax=Stylonychia lemnae TaxID=5949 RepID=A0A078AGI7_STYLE|nr:UNKNOWN [Stylonychia lemnae]|eukprot:CDW80652.1 UNKNOWN [Stylonychia lemnae]